MRSGARAVLAVWKTRHRVLEVAGLEMAKWGREEVRRRAGMQAGRDANVQAC